MTIGTFQCSVSMRVSFVLRSAEETLEMTMHLSDLKHRNDITTKLTVCTFTPQYIPGNPTIACIFSPQYISGNPTIACIFSPQYIPGNPTIACSFIPQYIPGNPAIACTFLEKTHN